MDFPEAGVYALIVIMHIFGTAAGQLAPLSPGGTL